MANSFIKLDIRSRIFSGIIFLLPALALTTPYGLGAIEVAFLFGAIFFAKPLWKQRNESFRHARWIIIAFAFNFISALTSLLLTGFQSSGIDNPFRELLAMAAIGLLVYTKPKADWFWYGLFVGAGGVACIALYQYFGLKLARAGGFHQIIMFGDISMAMALMSLASVGRFAETRLAPLPYLAFLSGLTASVLSGSRGGWISLVLISIPLQMFSKQVRSSRMMVVMSLAVVLLAIAAYYIPQSGVSHRFADISSDIRQYELGETFTSVGLRFETWKGAWQMFLEHPLNGVGRANFNNGLNELILRKEVDPDVRIIYHAHNELLNALATEGLVGAAALILLFGAPLAFFMRRCLQQESACRPYALAGALLVLSFICSGLTQVLFAHHVGAAFYALTVATLTGLCLMMERDRP